MGGSVTSKCLQAVQLAERFEKYCQDLEVALVASGSEHAKEYAEKLRGDLADYRERSILTLAFVGQYNAGKSTLISALTGARDIRTGSDITTDRTSEYEWSGLRLIDTPGLFTERADHDATTYDALKQADLILFCITSMLFDDVTADNFRKLAYDEGLAAKMMLVVNKLSAEAGPPEERIPRYLSSLRAALAPHYMNAFPVQFVDARDYVDGVDEEDAFLVQASRVPQLVREIDAFVAQRATLARMDTPIRIAIGTIDDAVPLFGRSEDEDGAYLALLSQSMRRVRIHRDRMRLKARIQGLELSANISGLGLTLSQQVGQEGFEVHLKETELQVQKLIDEHSELFDKLAEQTATELSRELGEVLNGELVLTLERRLGIESSIRAPLLDSSGAVETWRKQREVLTRLTQQAGSKLFELAGGAGVSGLLRSGEVAGSQMHSIVLGAGKFLGVKFKPWGAVNWAKFLGNAGQIVGPIASALNVAIELRSEAKDAERQKQLLETRREVQGQFNALGDSMKTALERSLCNDVEPQVFGKVEADLEASRARLTEELASSNRTVRALEEVRTSLLALAREIAAGTPS